MNMNNKALRDAIEAVKILSNEYMKTEVTEHLLLGNQLDLLAKAAERAIDGGPDRCSNLFECPSCKHHHCRNVKAPEQGDEG